MKKNLFLIISVFLLSLFLIPNKVLAETQTTGLKETVEEEIEIFKEAEGYDDLVAELENIDLSNYEESDDKVNVYLFRGNTCSHCFDAISFFASIANEYGEYFNLKAYEVWSNTDNADLMTTVGEKLGDDVSGVPYIVIGDKTWSGFADGYSEEIKTKIKEEYDKDSTNRYDIMKKLNTNKSDSKSNSNSNDVVSLIIIILVTGAIVAGIVITRKNT